MPTFTIKADQNTDIWRKPPKTDSFNAPCRPPPSHAPAEQLHRFRSATMTFRLGFREQYDQAGLLLTLSPDRPQGLPSAADKPPKWIKTGIEFHDGHPKLSTVACDAWADWSVAPADDVFPSGSAASTETEWVTVKVVAGGDDKGHSFWVYRVMEDGTTIPLREICWVAAQDLREWYLGVYAMAARPAAMPSSGDDTEGRLEAEFKDFQVEWEWELPQDTVAVTAFPDVHQPLGRRFDFSDAPANRRGRSLRSRRRNVT